MKAHKPAEWRLIPMARPMPHCRCGAIAYVRCLIDHTDRCLRCFAECDHPTRLGGVVSTPTLGPNFWHCPLCGAGDSVPLGESKTTALGWHVATAHPSSPAANLDPCRNCQPGAPCSAPNEESI